MSKEEIIRICKLICGTKNKNGKREYKTIERMNLLRDYNEDTLEEAIQGLLDLYNKEKEKNDTLINILEGIEDLKKTNRPIKELVDELNKWSNEYISKNKIKEKIKELEKTREMLTDGNGMLEISASIDILKELLEGE